MPREDWYFLDAPVVGDAHTVMFMCVHGATGDVIGTLVVRRRYLPQSPWRYAEITSLQVDEEYRRRGVGTALMDRCLDWAERSKYDRVSVEASAKEPRSAVAFYRACGFGECSIILDREP